MKIAIHHTPGTFSNRWIEHCEQFGINYGIVNCHDNDIVDQLRAYDALMWHYYHDNYKDSLLAKQLLFALEQAGKVVFPNFYTNWHFDDKVGQKYLLELFRAPLVPSYVFYDKAEAKQWALQTSYPKVFKIRRGAASSNVRLVKNDRQCMRLIDQAFGNGFGQFDPFQAFEDRTRRFRETKNPLELLKGLGRFVNPPAFARKAGRDRDYVYFQDYIPNNDFDIRLIVIGNRAYGMKRMVRSGDFRASGSGHFVYDDIEPDVLRVGFDVTKRLKLQCAAYDFIYHEGKPLIIEVSFGFGIKGSSKCKGYWDSELTWHNGEFNPQGWMVDAVLEEVTRLNKNRDDCRTVW